jgi:hypothetical protein
VVKARVLINYPIFRLGTTTLAILFLGCLQSLRCFALPPEEDLPEEILRTEIILEGRSPIDGKPLSAREYEELEAELRESRFDPQINEDVQQIIFLLQIRKLFKTIIPFI